MAITIQRGYYPGVLGRITEMHARYYHQQWGFGLFFESKVANDLSTFFQNFQPERDGLWTVVEDNRIIGSLALDLQHKPDEGHLRWFILDTPAQGQGMGKQLLSQAIAWSDAARIPLVYLETFAGLDAARHLYEWAGFTLTQEHRDVTWGVAVQEQRFERLLPEKLLIDFVFAS